MGNLVSLPWDGTTLGDAGPYSASEWQSAWKGMLGTGQGITVGKEQKDWGIFRKVGEAFRPSATGAANSISILEGTALINGVFVRQTSVPSIAASFDTNSSGFTRIDRVVLEANYVTQESNVVVIKGTPGASPTAPALTQSTLTKWQIPVCQVSLANGYASITQANVTDERVFIDISPGFQSYLQNQTGAEVTSGLGITRAASLDGYTLASIHNRSLWGVSQGTMANAGYGNVVAGQTRVRNTGSLTSGDFINIDTNGTFKSYNPLADYANAGPGVQMAIETTSNRYANALIFPRHLIFPRFIKTATTTQFSGSNASPTYARVGTGTSWECIITNRFGPVFVNAWFVCRNDTGGFGAFFKLYNNTTGTYISTQFSLALTGATWYIINIFGIDVAPTTAAANTYHLHGTAGGGGNWVTKEGEMWVMELGF